MRQDSPREERREYAGWIGEVRKKSALNQEAFGAQICHFEFSGEKEICMTYHRNSVGNWEKGKNLPRNLEAVLSIAMVEYNSPGEKNPEKEVEKRYHFVQERLQEYYGKYLYCRNINDALLIGVIMGIYRIEELPGERKKLRRILEETCMDKKDREIYALRKVTKNLEAELLQIRDREAFYSLIREWSSYLCSGSRTFGIRMKNMYEKKKKGKAGLTLGQGVNIYAPRYRESYHKIFSSDAGVSRRWIVDLCMHLRFSREEISQMLENANMPALSEDSLHWEGEIQGKDETGSVSWYADRAREDGYFSVRYSETVALSLKEKLALCTLTACWVWQEKDIREFPPIDYCLEYFLQCSEGKEILRQEEKTREEFSEQGEETPWKVYGRCAEQMAVLLWETGERAVSERERAAYQEYRREFSGYWEIPEEKQGKIVHRQQAEKLLFLAAFFFSVFTGKLYTGRIRQKDMDQVRKYIGENGGPAGAYYFLNNLWAAFLDVGELTEIEGKFFATRQTGKTPAVDLEDVLIGISTVWNLTCEECTN